MRKFYLPIISVFVVVLIVFYFGFKNDVGQRFGFYKSNSDDTAETIHHAKGIIAKELTENVFFGTEPNWSLTFFNDYAEFKSTDDKIVLLYCLAFEKQQDLKLIEAIKLISEVELVILAKSNSKKISITIKAEECSYATPSSSSTFSISIEGINDLGTLYGCGREMNYKINLSAEKENYEYLLNLLITELTTDFTDGLFYSNNIKDFVLYQTSDEFRYFIDELIDLGYGVEQAEGRYYLYIGTPKNYKDGEVD